MTSLLQQVLQTIEQADEPYTLTQLARELDLSPAMLEGMLVYWVRKGRLRETTSSPACAACSLGAGCPFVAKMPRSFEVVRDDDPPGDLPPTCRCCR